MARKLRFFFLKIRFTSKGIDQDDDLGNDVGGLGGDAALVARVPGHPDVSGLSPRGAPRVLDQPVVLSVTGGAVASRQDAVVQAEGGAGGRVVDAGVVELEGVVAGVNGNRDGALGHGALE